MTRFLVNRIISIIPVLLGITLVTFFAVRLIPGDVTTVMLDQEATPELQAEIRRTLGLDQPLHMQLFDWFAHLARLDFGKSFMTGLPILPEALRRVPPTLELAFFATSVSLILAIPLGVLTAIKRGGFWDYLERAVSLLGISVPDFWLALLLIQFIALELGLLPAIGYVPFREDPAENIRHLILPVIALGTRMAAVTARYTRSGMLEVLHEDYIRTARAKGLNEKAVVAKHALRNTLVPVVTIVGIQMGTLIAGTVIIEEIFAWPGLGRFTLQAIHDRDYPVVQTMVMIMAFFYVVINLVTDVVYVYLDPRIRYE